MLHEVTTCQNIYIVLLPVRKKLVDYNFFNPLCKFQGGANLGIISGPLIICGIIWGSFTDLPADLRHMETSNVYVTLISRSTEKD